MTRVLALAALLTIAASAAWAAEAPTTVLLVRHAEKAKGEGRDPALTARGTARAQALARALGPVPVAAIYSTPFKRTQATAAPTAAAKGLSVQVTPAERGFPKALAERILREHRGRTVLVVGHSNTLGPTLAALDAGPTFTLDESEFGDLFVATVPARGPGSVVRLALPPWPTTPDPKGD